MGIPQAVFLREAMSHARTDWQTAIESLLSNGCMTGWEHTANAVTAREREAFSSQSAWLKVEDGQADSFRLPDDTGIGDVA